MCRAGLTPGTSRPVSSRYQDPDIDVQLSSELSDSLRTLKVLVPLGTEGEAPVPSDDTHPCSPCPPGTVGDTTATPRRGQWG